MPSRYRASLAIKTHENKRREHYARPNDDAAADRLFPAGTCGALSRRHRDSLPHGRGYASPLHLCPSASTRQESRQCPDEARGSTGRSRWHPGVERLSPFRALLRHLRHGGDHSYHQSPPVSGADQLDSQRRRRWCRLLRPELCIAGRIHSSQVPEREVLGRHDQPCAHAGLGHPEPAVLRGPAGRGVRGFRLAPAR
ncbi:hypothetical protein D9M70_535710 [compost metagenome]